MKKNIIQFSSLIFIALVLILFMSGQNPAQDKKGDEKIQPLIDRIEALEKKVKEQDTKISELNSELDKIKNSNPMFAIPNLPDLKNLPKGSKPFQFNGQTYYMVPVNVKSDVK